VTPSDGTVVVTGHDINLSVAFTAFANPAKVTTLYFNESGLVSNTTWSVLVGGVGTVSSSLPSLNFSLPVNSTYNGTPQIVAGYSVVPNATVTALTDVPATVLLNYTDNILPVFALTFNATGLPAGQSWTVNLTGAGSPFALSSTASMITFYETNGTYAAKYTVPATVVAQAPTSTVVVAGNTTVQVVLTPVHKAFALAFSETGLPAGTEWGITIGNFTITGKAASLTFELANGTYNWTIVVVSGYVTTTPNGSALVAGSSTASVSLTFTQYTYTVTFIESGLPSGTPWTVTIGTKVTGSTSVTLAVELPNGTFGYSLSVPAGYEALPAAIGDVVVAASETNVSITYVLVFDVVFTETGLPSGQSWTVDFAGQTLTGTTSSLTFSVANGTWSYGVTAPSGYYANTAGGQVGVSGAGSTVPIQFSSTKPSATYLGNFAYELIGAVAVLALVGFALAAYFARRRPPASPPPKGWSEQSSEPASKDDKGSPGS
jgi:hypothetical protein